MEWPIQQLDHKTFEEVLDLELLLNLGAPTFQATDEVVISPVDAKISYSINLYAEK